MKKLGMALLALGCLIVVASFNFDTAPDGTHNIGLLQEQMMIFCSGALAVMVGALAAVAGHAISQLPPAPEPQA